MASLDDVTHLSSEEKTYNTETDFRIVPKMTIDQKDAGEVLAVRFSPCGNFLASGNSDGSIRIFNIVDGTVAHIIESGSSAALPTTCIRFRPQNYHSSTQTRNVFLTANAAGAVQHWHMTSGKCLHTFTDEENEINALDYNDDGSQFATGGRDTKIRIYDEATKSLVATLEGGIRGDRSHDAPGHSNRVFSVKFTHDENILLSGGWDNTVHIWDTRIGSSVRLLYGPHICGDALDIKGNEILTGSWRSSEQLELWDFGSGKRISEIPWSTGQSQFASSSQEPCMLYAAQFSKDPVGRFIAAGGSGANEAKIFDHATGNALVGTVTGLGRGVFSIDFSPDREKIAIGSGDHCIRIVDVVRKHHHK